MFTMLCFGACKKDLESQPTAEGREKYTFSSGYYKIGTVIGNERNIASFNRRVDMSYVTFIPFQNPFSSPALNIYNPAAEVARSTNGLYSMFFQGDGNLVLYKRTTPNGTINWDALWASNAYGLNVPAPAGNYAYRVNFQNTDGNIVCTNYPFTPAKLYWQSLFTAGPRPIWIMQNDGNFVGYSNYEVAGDSEEGIRILGPAFAATFTDGGRKSNNFGRMGQVR